VNGIPGQIIDEGKTFKSIQLDQFVQDTESKANEMSWTVSGQKDLMININAARVATIQIPDRDWNGSENVTFTARDPQGAQGAQTITLTVNSINDLPVLKPIPGQNVEEGKLFQAIRLDDYIEDPDHPDDQIQWNLEINPQGKSFNDLPLMGEVDANRIAKIYAPDTNWYGSASVTFTATDPEGASVNTKAIFAVRSVNDQPVVIKIPDQKIQEGEQFQPINLLEYVSDADHDPATIKWQVTGGMRLKVNVDAGNVATVLIPDENWNGAPETFTFTARDPQGGSANTTATFAVGSVNDLPEVQQIPDQTIDEGKQFTRINLNDVVEDADHRDNEIKWTFVGNKQLKLTNVGGIVTIETPDENWNGQESITFVATDPEGGTAQTTASFIVNSINDIPVLQKLTPQTIAEGKQFGQVLLDALVEDADHPDEQISWDFEVKHKGKMPDMGTLTVLMDASRKATIAIPDTNWNGSATVTFTALDPEGGKASVSTDYTVQSINDIPAVRPIQAQQITEGSEFTSISLDEYVFDSDHPTDQLRWTASGQKELQVIISKDRIATIKIPNSNWNGPTEKITFTVTDPENGKASVTTDFTVTSINDLPVVKEIPNQSIREGASFATIKLDDYVSDEDHKDSEIKWTFSGNQDLKVNLDANRIATIAIPDTNWHGEENITFLATDPEKGTAQAMASFQVKSVNDLPVLKPIPDQNIQEGESFKPIPLDSYVFDADHNHNELAWEFSSKVAGRGQNAPELQVIIDEKRNAIVSIPDTNWNGAETVTFTVTDPEGAKKSVSANFTVRSVNDIPMMQPIAAQTIKEGESFQPIPLSSIVRDSDHDLNSLKWSVTGNRQLKVDIKDGMATITAPNQDWNGPAEQIKFTVTDPENGSASQTAAFTVTSVNDVPVLKEIPSQNLKEGDQFQPVVLKDLVSDADHNFTQLKWTVTGNKDLQVQISGPTARIVTPDKEWNGEETMTFTVTDPEGAKASGTATFAMASINDLPQLRNIMNQTINEGQTFKPVKLDDFVQDADHKAAQLSWAFESRKAGKNGGAGELKVNVDGDRVAQIMIPDTNWNGSEEIKFTVTDPENGKAEIVAKFEVRSINDKPFFKAAIPGQKIQEGEKFNDVNLNDYVVDTDHPNDKLMWTVSGNRDLKVTIGKDNVAKVTAPSPDWNGKETIKFSVKDPENGVAFADVVFEATSVNDLPVISGLKGQTIKEGASFTEIKLDDFVKDADHQNSQLKWTVTGNKLLKITVSGMRVATVSTPNENWNGSEALTFTVTDPENGQASVAVDFIVESVNDIPVLKKIPDQVINEGEQFQTVPLNQFVTDVDHKPADLQWKVEIDQPGKNKSEGPDLSVQIDGNRVAKIMQPDTNWNGTRNITFRVRDPEGGEAAITASFSAKSINDLPAINPALGKAFVLKEGEEIPEIDLNKMVFDSDHELKDMKWTISGNKDLKVTLDPKTQKVSIQVPNENWHGKETILFAVTDPAGGKVSIKKDVELKSVNDLPVLKTVPDQTIKEGASFKPIDLDAIVTDVDHADKDLVWKISGTNSLKASINKERQVEITAPNEDFNGPAENITFSVKDPEGGVASVMAKFEVTSVNDAPMIADIPDASINEGVNLPSLTLDNFVKDVDHEKNELNWSVTVAKGSTVPRGDKSPMGLEAMIDANRVLRLKVPDENWHGDRVLKLLVKDPEGGTASKDVNINIISVNDEPVFGKIPPMTIQEGDKFPALELRNYVKDADHPVEKLQFRVSGNKELKATITKNDELVVTAPDKDWSGKETLTIDVKDPEEGMAKTTVVYTATPVNDAPVIDSKKLKDQVIDEGENFASIKLADIVSDVDNTNSELKWSVSGGDKIKLKLDKGLAVPVVPGKDWFGEKETFVLTVTDKGGASATAKVSFTVKPVNDAPVVGEIPAQTIQEGEQFKIIDLNKYVKDVDNNNSELRWTYNCQTPDKKRRKASEIPAGCKTHELIVEINSKNEARVTTPNPDWHGKAEVSFTAWDPADAFHTNAAKLTVTSVNDAPQVRAPSGDFVVDEGKQFPVIDMNELVRDVDHKTSEISWKVSGDRHMDVRIAGGKAYVSPKRADWSGKETLTFTAVDKAGASASFEKLFTVNHVNRKPEMRNIPNQRIKEDESFKSFKMDDHARDKDHQQRELKWEFSGNKELQVNIDLVKRLVSVRAPRPDWNGKAEKICFKVTDPEGATAQECATYTVVPVNDEPVVMPHAYQAKEGTPLTVGKNDGLLSNAKDVDGPLPLTCVLVKKPKNGFLDLNRDGSFKYVPKPGFYGLDEFSFAAQDKSGGKSKPARVEINVQFKMGDVRE